MKPDQQINELLALFLAGFSAMIAKLIKAGTNPSWQVVLVEVSIGCFFCFILAPAAKVHWGLGIEMTCFLAWVGSYFSGIILQGAESIIKTWFAQVRDVLKSKNKS